MSSSRREKRRKIVDMSHTFDLPQALTGKPETILFKIHGFPEREEKRGESFWTEPARAHGHEWKLWIFPRGDENSSGEAEHVSIFLGTSSKVKVKAVCMLGSRKMSADSFCCLAETWGYCDFCKREDFLNQFVDSHGTATVEAAVDIFVPQKNVWYPKLQSNDWYLSKMYDCENSKDVSFVVEGSTFKAHRLVLQHRAPQLLDSADGPSPIELPDTTRKEVFETIIKHIYSVLDYNKICTSYEDTIKLLEESNKWACTDLKLFVESKITDTLLTAENAVSLFLLADRLSCPLLKEAAFKVYFQNQEEGFKSKDWASIAESTALLKEMLQFSAIGPFLPADSDAIKKKMTLTAEEISNLDVTTLRECLDAAELDLDGSQETLKKRLTAYHAEKSNFKDDKTSSA